jgi:signal transduction histidine kinase
MARRDTSLRSVIAVAVGGITVLALSATAALVVLTTLLHRTTQAAQMAVESVRLAEEAENTLLLHARARDPIVAAEIASELSQQLVDARQYVTTQQEDRVLADARDATERYLSAGSADAQQRAYESIEALVDQNVTQARDAQRIAMAWDRNANVVGAALGAALVALAGTILVWLRRRAFAPMLSLGRAMARFADGDRDARAADDDGPAELRDMNRRFNQMAATIAAQRTAQIAFVGAVAHDLRGPLSAQRLAVALLRNERGALSSRALHALDRIDAQVGRLDRMVADFLDVARIDAGELDMNIERHDLARVVEESVALFASPAIGFRCAGPAFVDGDRLRLEQVVTNLIGNAVKYSPPGSPVDVVVDRVDDEVRVTVTDRGVGIAPDDQARIFEPFRRVSRVRGGPPGTGLGLSIVKRIVAAHHGHIDVTSELGAGSTFRVTFPAAESRRAPIVRDDRAVGRGR